MYGSNTKSPELFHFDADVPFGGFLHDLRDAPRLFVEEHRPLLYRDRRFRFTTDQGVRFRFRPRFQYVRIVNGIG